MMDKKTVSFIPLSFSPITASSQLFSSFNNLLFSANLNIQIFFHFRDFFFSCYLSLNNFDSIFYSLPHGSKLFFTNYYILSLIVSFCISLLFQDFFLSYDLNFKPLLFSYSWFPTHFTVKNRLLASVLQYQDRAWRLPLHPNKR